MLYKFKSKAGADVIMTGPPGEQVLRLLGRDPAAPGIFLADQLPQAVAALEQAVAADESAFTQKLAEAKAAGEPAPRREGVTLKQRAWPLVELMRHALKDGEDVSWGA